MSITSDLRSYADTAVNQGKQVVDQAQAQLNDVAGQANEFVGKYRDNVSGIADKATHTVSDIADKATEAVTDLRHSAEKAINLEAIKSAVEPYLAQVKGYTHKLTDTAEGLYSTVKSDPRLAKLVDAAGAVVGTVQVRVVKPVQDLTGLGAKPAAKPASRPAPVKATRPAATKPATKRPAAKATTRKAPVKRAAKD